MQNILKYSSQAYIATREITPENLTYKIPLVINQQVDFIIDIPTPELISIFLLLK